MKIDQLKWKRAQQMRTETANALGALRSFRGDLAKALRRLNGAYKRLGASAARYEGALAGDGGDLEITGAPTLPTMTFLVQQLSSDLTGFRDELTSVFSELQDHEKTLKKRRGRKSRVDRVEAQEARRAARKAKKKAGG